MNSSCGEQKQEHIWWNAISKPLHIIWRQFSFLHLSAFINYDLWVGKQELTWRWNGYIGSWQINGWGSLIGYSLRKITCLCHWMWKKTSTIAAANHLGIHSKSRQKKVLVQHLNNTIKWKMLFMISDINKWFSCFPRWYWCCAFSWEHSIKCYATFPLCGLICPSWCHRKLWSLIYWLINASSKSKVI